MPDLSLEEILVFGSVPLLVISALVLARIQSLGLELT